MVDISSTRAYTSWWQARSDTWSRLEEASGQLAAAFAAGRADEELVEATSGLLDALAPAERYWAYPGPEALRQVRDLFAAPSRSDAERRLKHCTELLEAYAERVYDAAHQL